MENEKVKNKGGALFTVFACIMTGIIVFFATTIGQDLAKSNDKETKKTNSSNSNSNTESNSNVTSNVESNSNSNSNNAELTVRSYRFFGSIEGRDSDMYTTLKLYSNSKYELYANTCSSVKKYSGTYTETNDKVTFSGDLNMSFNKKNNGKSLDFDYSKVALCGNTGGNFNLESDALAGNTNPEPASVKTYRFFGHLDGKTADMYTTLKLYSDNKYVLYTNGGSRVQKYSGTYTETNDNITFTGDLKTSFAKKDNGTTLDFNYSSVIIFDNTGGNFRLESNALAK